MRIGFYGKPSLGILLDLAKGFEELGHTPMFRRDSVFTPDQTEDIFGLVVVQGLRGKAPEIRACYRRRGVPVLVADAGHLRRDLAYHRLSINDHEWIAPGPCPADRWKALKLDIKPRGKGEHILILGQMPNDSSHNWGKEQIVQWARALVRELRRYSDRPIIWRPHPRGEFEIGHKETGVQTSWHFQRTLDQDFADAHVALTMCSTAGFEAILAGVPCYTRTPAFYQELAFQDLEHLEDAPLPSVKEREAFCRRVAYTQWQVREYHTGEPQRHYLAWLQGDSPFSAVVEPEPEEAPAEVKAEPFTPPVSAAVRARLIEAGLDSREAVGEASDEALLAVRGVGQKSVEALRGWN